MQATHVKRGACIWRRPPVQPWASEATGSDRERAPAAPPARGLRVVEREPGALDRGDVVNGHAVQVLGAERVYEDPQSLGLDDHVVVQRALLHVEPVLEPGTAAGQNRHAEPRRLQRNLLLLDEPLHLLVGAVGEANRYRGLGTLRRAHECSWVGPQVRKAPWLCKRLPRGNSFQPGVSRWLKRMPQRCSIRARR